MSTLVFSLLGCVMWCCILLYVFLIRPKSKLQASSAFALTNGTDRFSLGKLASIIACLLTVLICVLPMGLSPVWNGENPQHRNQYEMMARSLSHGHIYLEYDDVDPKLEEMENPYDPEARMLAEVREHSDHAYYKGKYYMYFGVVPAVVLFLPYYLITGKDLTTYHATQIFAALAIIGLFLLFHKLAKQYFKGMPRIMLVSLSVCLSLIPVYFSAGYPALYCTAIISGVCFEVWSLYFFFNAVYLIDGEKAKNKVIMAVIGGLLGALAFGCRPTVALGNLVLIPMLVKYIRDERTREDRVKIGRLLLRIFLVLIPYFVIGGLLMAYNYARFENPFEFGQALQLTGFDQTNFGKLSNFSPVETFNGIVLNFIGFTPITGNFPYVYFNSVFVNFPILAFIFAVFGAKVRQNLKNSKMFALSVTFAAVVLFIDFMQVQWGPGMANAERYRTDFYFLIAILAFIVIGHTFNSVEADGKKRFSFAIGLFCLEAVFMCMLFLMIADDGSYTACYPEMLDKLKHFVLIF